jgi:hypothetical protein
VIPLTHPSGLPPARRPVPANGLGALAELPAAPPGNLGLVPSAHPACAQHEITQVSWRMAAAVLDSSHVGVSLRAKRSAPWGPGRRS